MQYILTVTSFPESQEEVENDIGSLSINTTAQLALRGPAVPALLLSQYRTLFQTIIAMNLGLDLACWVALGEISRMAWMVN